MKKIKKTLTLLLALCVLCFSGCSIMDNMEEGMLQAVNITEKFCDAIVKNDLSTAKNYLHQNSTPSAQNLANYIFQLEKTYNIDFSDGISFKQRVAFEISYYNSNYGGSVYSNTYKTTVGKTEIYLLFVVVKIDNVYTLHEFGVADFFTTYA